MLFKNSNLDRLANELFSLKYYNISIHLLLKIFCRVCLLKNRLRPEISKKKHVNILLYYRDTPPPWVLRSFRPGETDGMVRNNKVPILELHFFYYY